MTLRYCELECESGMTFEQPQWPLTPVQLLVRDGKVFAYWLEYDTRGLLSGAIVNGVQV